MEWSKECPTPGLWYATKYGDVRLVRVFEFEAGALGFYVIEPTPRSLFVFPQDNVPNDILWCRVPDAPPFPSGMATLVN